MATARIVTDLGFGDGGKGTFVDWFAKGTTAVFRFNGGCQAAHNVLTPERKRHCFSQFCSGMFHPTVKSVLTKYFLFDPTSFINEDRHLQKLGVKNTYERVFIDDQALMVTPIHMAANRLKELMRSKRHGSCGLGIGETAADALSLPPGMVVRVADMLHTKELCKKLDALRKYKIKTLDLTNLPKSVESDKASRFLLDDEILHMYVEACREIRSKIHIVPSSAILKMMTGDIVFEGAQGVLLDEWRGFHPHTTWSTTTTENAIKLLDEANYRGTRERIGVLRPYMTRHGAGPLPTEDEAVRPVLVNEYNQTGTWQQTFRVGWLDLVMMRYALKVNKVDVLALSCLDQIRGRTMKVSNRYTETVDLAISTKNDLVHQEALTELLKQYHPDYEEIPGEAMMSAIAIKLKVPVRYTSSGPTRESKVEIPSLVDDFEVSRVSWAEMVEAERKNL